MTVPNPLEVEITKDYDGQGHMTPECNPSSVFYKTRFEVVDVEMSRNYEGNESSGLGIQFKLDNEVFNISGKDANRLRKFLNTMFSEED